MWFGENAFTYGMSQLDRMLESASKRYPVAANIAKYVRHANIPFARVMSNAIGDALETSNGWNGLPTAYKYLNYKMINGRAIRDAVDEATKRGEDETSARATATAKYGKLTPEQQIGMKRTVAKGILGIVANIIGAYANHKGALTAPGQNGKYDRGTLKIGKGGINASYYEPISSSYLTGAAMNQMAETLAHGGSVGFGDIAKLVLAPVENAPLVGPVSDLASGSQSAINRFLANQIPTPTIVNEGASWTDPTGSMRSKQSILQYKMNEIPALHNRNPLAHDLSGKQIPDMNRIPFVSLASPSTAKPSPIDVLLNHYDQLNQNKANLNPSQKMELRNEYRQLRPYFRQWTQEKAEAQK
jgi:hypothetical protein